MRCRIAARAGSALVALALVIMLLAVAAGTAAAHTTSYAKTIEDGRARFNWQDRKKHDLKAQPEHRCQGCRYAGVCEGVWKNYLPVHGDAELHAIR